MNNCHLCRWVTALLCFLLAAQVHANSFRFQSSELYDAQQLLNIAPAQSQSVAQQYLQQRRLANSGDQSPSTLSRDDSDAHLRTPSGSIQAHMIIAKANFIQGNPTHAFNHLSSALALSETFRLPFLAIEAEMAFADFNWQLDHDDSKAQQSLKLIENKLYAIDKKATLSKETWYHLAMLKAQIAAQQGDLSSAEQHFKQAKHFLGSQASDDLTIEYHLSAGQFYLQFKQYNHALTELLFAYWHAVEHNKSILLAQINQQLALLFKQRRVFDKALQYASQAAEFFDHYPDSNALAQTLTLMGDMYFKQGKYNLALVHYFNVLDHSATEKDLSKILRIRLDLAATYLQLYNYPLADQYLQQADQILSNTAFPVAKIRATRLKAQLYLNQKNYSQAIDLSQRALSLIAHSSQASSEQKLKVYLLLAQAYQQSRQYQSAFTYLERYQALLHQQQTKLNEISEDAFRQQKEFAEQTLHLSSQADHLKSAQHRLSKYQLFVYGLSTIVMALLVFVWRQRIVIQRQTEQLTTLSGELYTHSRSHLRNLRMLNLKLRKSLLKANASFEQWHLGDLVHEPLNDKLKFVMIDLPFLRSMYVKHGYKKGLELEGAFGDFLSKQADTDSRIYHFSDANLLYIEPSSDGTVAIDTQAMFDKIQAWVSDFAKQYDLNPTIRIGMADYPFLPRAYTAINDQELLDILLLATHIAREISLHDQQSHWVYLKAIKNAPAASLAKDNIRHACQQAIEQGLIKLQSSYENEHEIKNILKKE